MSTAPAIFRVELRFVGVAPARHVGRASRVSAVAVEGSNLRCVVVGSFQPFREALRGHDVISLTATPIPDSRRS